MRISIYDRECTALRPIGQWISIEIFCLEETNVCMHHGPLYIRL